MKYLRVCERILLSSNWPSRRVLAAVSTIHMPTTVLPLAPSTGSSTTVAANVA